jgi:hypothetical protein
VVLALRQHCQTNVSCNNGFASSNYSPINTNLICCVVGIFIYFWISAYTQLSTPNSTYDSKSPTAIIVNHSKLQKDKCFLSQKKELGNIGDCPRRSRVSWKWIGEFDMASFSRYQAIKTHHRRNEQQQQEHEEMQKPLATRHTIDFSCGITLEGQNVFQGLQALIAMGYTQSPLPDFVRDAPTIGFDVIEVHNGRLVSSRPKI